eukprot:Opistho-1_new@29744
MATGSDAGQDLGGVVGVQGRERMEDGSVVEDATRRAVQDRRQAGIEVGRPAGARRDEGEVVRQGAVGLEAVLDQEEGDLLAVGRRAEIHGAGPGGDVQGVVEQHLHVVDGAVGGDLVGAERVAILRRGGLQLEREAGRAVAGEEGIVDDTIDRFRRNAPAFGKGRQVRLEGEQGMRIGPGAARHHHEVAVRVVALHLDGRAADLQGDAVGLVVHVEIRPAGPHALDVDRVVGPETGNGVAVEVGQGVAHGVGTGAGVDPVGAFATDDGVDARAAIDRVVAGAAHDRVVAVTAEQRVVAATAVDRIVTSGAVDTVGGRAAKHRVGGMVTDLGRQPLDLHVVDVEVVALVLRRVGRDEQARVGDVRATRITGVGAPRPAVRSAGLRRTPQVDMELLRLGGDVLRVFADQLSVDEPTHDRGRPLEAINVVDGQSAIHGKGMWRAGLLLLENAHVLCVD